MYCLVSCVCLVSGQVYAVSYLVEVALLQLLVIGPMSGSLHCVVYWEVCAARGWLVYWFDLSCGLVQGRGVPLAGISSLFMVCLGLPVVCSIVWISWCTVRVTVCGKHVGFK